MNDPTEPVQTPDPPADDGRTTVVIIGDHAGWTVDATIDGAVFSSPAPLSADAAVDHLRVVLAGLLDLDRPAGPNA